ncbi:MAG: sigma-E factor negative regulatory protein [Lamprocystis purpurea]|uniref:sigma-E factor negative regulatory protein n=1 Tax=Lamprocystis purpurea TaxID=61598 RepID=UPI0003796E1B|nr:sigma-E factor negative regulatory protein [Lamprocystis purpurea]MBV5275503.1 sigma-E factor negative regulatory protein [Lamprocystis purpurea]
MTAEQVSQLSALVDGELATRHAVPLVHSVGQDPALRATWERYHLIGQVLRGERVQSEVRGVAAAVRDRLRSEPTLVMPRAVVGVRSRIWHSPLAGAAMAAGVVLLAVFAVPGFYRGPVSGTELTADRSAGAQPARSAAVGDAAIDHALRRWQTDRDALASKLDVFLVNHQETAPAAGVKGLLPYATLVGYERVR